MRGLLGTTLALGVVIALGASNLTHYQKAKQKIDLIEGDRAPRGARITLSEEELDAYVRGEIPTVAGQGAVKSSKVKLRANGGRVDAQVDFIQLQKNTGRKPGWLLSRLLRGEHSVSASVRMQSAKGQATVWVDEVTLNGVALGGPLLDFLMDAFITPKFPDVKIGEPFPLKHDVERVDIRPDAVHVQIRR
ncbi:MAG TPA: hypothetical protein DEH78_14600 [Solibacterales bacterium]|nr:hypothetical protein [Bryobacterales bacterium]